MLLGLRAAWDAGRARSGQAFARVAAVALLSAGAAGCALPGPSLAAPVAVASEAPRTAARPTSCPEGMVLLTGGRLGGPGGGVTVGRFCLGRHEVTVAEYRRCVDAGACEPPRRGVAYGGDGRVQAPSRWCNRLATDRDDHPVNCIAHADAVAVCRFRGGRLPTVAEWRWTAEGAEGRSSPWGEGPLDATRANVAGTETSPQTVAHARRAPLDDGHEGTAPVGAFPRGDTPDGVADLGGNVAEWCDARDPATPGPAGRPGPGKAPLLGASFLDDDPRGQQRGAWLEARDLDEATGVRCAADPGEPPK